MEIYDDPAMALIYSIVESSTDCNSSDFKLDKIVEKSFAIFKLAEETQKKTYIESQKWAYLRARHLMEPLYNHIMGGGTIKQFCDISDVNYNRMVIAFIYYRKINGLKIEGRSNFKHE